RDEDTFRVFFLSDRFGIYALGYPVIAPAGHLMNLAELVLLVGVLYVASRLLLTLVGILTMRTPASGRALLREVRSSFYRKLFLAFWAGAVVPVSILALVTRTYVQTQLNETAEEAAARTVTTAQRLVEDYAARQAATESSPSRSPTGSRRSNSRSTTSIGLCFPGSCCSACSARRLATGWPSGSPTRSIA